MVRRDRSAFSKGGSLRVVSQYSALSNFLCASSNISLSNSICAVCLSIIFLRCSRCFRTTSQFGQSVNIQTSLGLVSLVPQQYESGLLAAHLEILDLLRFQTQYNSTVFVCAFHRQTSLCRVLLYSPRFTSPQSRVSLDRNSYTFRSLPLL